MAYLWLWFYDDQKDSTHLQIDDGHEWKPCFAQLQHEKSSKYLHLVTKNTGEYTEKFFNSQSFARRVRYWLAIGNKIGLRFKNTTFRITGQYLIFTIDNKEIYKGMPKNLNKKKFLHLHCFFLRLLNETTAAFFLFAQYRKSFIKKYPKAPLCVLLYLASGEISSAEWGKSKEELYKLFRYKITSYNNTAPYFTSGHNFVLLIKAQIKSALLCKNIVEPFKKYPTITNFNFEMFDKSVNEDRYSYIAITNFKELYDKYS
jgi:hypothetical protein